MNWKSDSVQKSNIKELSKGNIELERYKGADQIAVFFDKRCKKQFSRLYFQEASALKNGHYSPYDYLVKDNEYMKEHFDGLIEVDFNKSDPKNKDMIVQCHICGDSHKINKTSFSNRMHSKKQSSNTKLCDNVLGIATLEEYKLIADKHLKGNALFLSLKNEQVKTLSNGRLHIPNDSPVEKMKNKSFKVAVEDDQGHKIDMSLSNLLTHLKKDSNYIPKKLANMNRSETVVKKSNANTEDPISIIKSILDSHDISYEDESKQDNNVRSDLKSDLMFIHEGKRVFIDHNQNKDKAHDKEFIAFRTKSRYVNIIDGDLLDDILKMTIHKEESTDKEKDKIHKSVQVKKDDKEITINLNIDL